MSDRWNILIVGDPDGVNLESLYQRAFESLGHTVAIFPMGSQLDKYARFGKLGRTFQSFVPVVPWIRKANRELVVTALQNSCDLILVFGSTPVLAGALAQVRASVNSRLAWIWPDTLLNLSDSIVTCLPLFHAVFTYSSKSVPILQRLRAEQVTWLPLAGDAIMHKPAIPGRDEKDIYGADVTFVGGWRPEREKALALLTRFHLKIWGPDWGRRAVDSGVRKAWQGRALRGPEFAKAVSASLLNLNMIDPTNSPAANMRFFEIPAAGGAELCSACAELEPIFRDNEHMFYYRTAQELPPKVERLLGDQAKCREVAQAGHALLESKHTYVHRVQVICEFLSQK